MLYARSGCPGLAIAAITSIILVLAEFACADLVAIEPAGGDFDAALTASAIVGGPGDVNWSSTPLFVANVESFLDEPLTNFGWIMIGNESVPGTAKRFSTREEADVALRPFLTIAYTPVPEPGSLTLWVLGIAGALGGRRDGRLTDPRSNHSCTSGLKEPNQ